jgi:hypothetical protein
MKADIKGAAARMQGYAAREGFGITLTRNQAVDRTPMTKKMTLVGTLYLKSLLKSV